VEIYPNRSFRQKLSQGNSGQNERNYPDCGVPPLGNFWIYRHQTIMNVIVITSAMLRTKCRFQSIPDLTGIVKGHVSDRCGVSRKEKAKFNGVASSGIKWLHPELAQRAKVVSYRIRHVLFLIKISPIVKHFARIEPFAISIIQLVCIEWKMTRIPGISQVNRQVEK
jgi:hypothetical protein